MISKATHKDAKKLSEASALAFIEDQKYQPDGATVLGPPGHDDVDKHRQWIDQYFYIKYTLESDLIAGGCMVEFSDNHGQIHGLFVHSDHMNKGIGKDLINYLFTNFPDIEVWGLQTPDYASRNQFFYEKLGFKCKNIIAADEKIGFGFHEYELRI